MSENGQGKKKGVRQSLFYQAAKILNDLSAAKGDALGDFVYEFKEQEQGWGPKGKAWGEACARLAEILPRLRERLDERKVNSTFDASGFEAVFGADGQTFVVGPEGKTDDRLSIPWLLLFAEFLESRGISPKNVVFTLPDGRRAHVEAEADGGLGFTVEEAGGKS